MRAGPQDASPTFRLGGIGDIHPDEMSAPEPPAFSAFSTDRLIVRGEIRDVVRALHGRGDPAVLVLADASGEVVDLDLRGSLEDAL
ncbi:MAG: hypothetical protein JSS35_12055, partial [Proteobacteria bacterium]|nr:hypothetical protein [Pseudomonadota bacterium]